MREMAHLEVEHRSSAIFESSLMDRRLYPPGLLTGQPTVFAVHDDS
eukprot:CAMPEP_0119199444 /NCGR_PEP_ID=MMETSP1316-20130426/22730_1 /TAXON_ID=41880 /ORGANISM="Pycnococcus provasolii, Strain RCC2336" /LENGTH=45 /DNA_ID= /DNA_START= /DNA_END= /DNA_ORIENTATION=